MKSFVTALKSLLKILSQSKPIVTEEECRKARQHLKELDDAWKVLRQSPFVICEMPPKYHYLKECVEFVDLWKMPLGFCCEQSIEALHQVCNAVRRAYLNQRGILRVLFMMHKMTLITAPEFCDGFAYSVEDEE